MSGVAGTVLCTRQVGHGDQSPDLFKGAGRTGAETVMQAAARADPGHRAGGGGSASAELEPNKKALVSWGPREPRGKHCH